MTTTADKTTTATSFLEALKRDPIDPSALESLLTEDAALMSTGGNAIGRAAVLQRMTQPAGKVYREASWLQPETLDGGRVKVNGTVPAGNGSPILVFQFRDDKISLLQHQFYTARAGRKGDPIKLTDDIKDRVNHSLERAHPIVVAYVDENGAPVLSFRGSLQAFSDTQLAFWVRPESRIIEAVKLNPNLSFIYRNEENHEGMQFSGRGRISTDPIETQRVYTNSPDIEQERDLAKLGVAIIVDLDLVEGSIVKMQRSTERIRMES